MYVALIFYVLALLFSISVLAWLRQNPVLPLNHEYERHYRPAYRPVLAGPTNHFQAFAVTAGSSSAIISSLTSAQIQQRRALEDALWGVLPGVEE